MAKYSTRAPVVFNPAAATVSFESFINFDVRSLYAIVDLTAAQPIYLQGISNYGYSAISPDGKTLTLQASMTGFASTDKLAVTYDDGYDAIGDLVALVSGDISRMQEAPNPSSAVIFNGSRGILSRAQTTDDLLRMCFAAIRVLTRMSIVDKQVADSDIDSMLHDELNNSTWL